MKVGDLVKVVGSHATITGVILESWKPASSPGWWMLLTQRGDVIHWPESQMELVK